MPIDSHVHKVYEALLREGHSEESAARIAQWRTGDSLETGKPAMHENQSEDFENSEHFKNGVLQGKAYLHGLGLWVDGAIKK